MTATRPADSASNTPPTITKDSADDTDLSSKTISSPHELTDWVDGLLDTLQSRFDVMQGQVEERMSEMARRIDTLENSIEELLQGQSGVAQNASEN
ncbi:hypothetical protein BCV69DRAFT_297708 [Microstroma glucosiphilum]|uniref:Heat shock factor binding protein 1 n=1 Tax=Pseudomicrostroma glucosiphilum TaxID=1684307 RepID=A0A316UC21_9BASI|nr:hypothetical protein BCV69DRAFT_297708 [Pseudomicrostroma glucosiphilum]PWN22418.1 hypothetical protein BCV69DRAFT_297708 [Pseudomicrostroma glucosiphilum]